MITLWNRYEVYIGFSMRDYSKIRDILIDNKIKYISRTVNHSVRGHIVSTMINLDYSRMYYIYVHKKDAPKVRGLIH